MSSRKPVMVLALAFACLFFGFDGVQQQVVAVMAKLGQPSLGYNILLLVYVCFLAFDPIASWLTKKMGARLGLWLGMLPYPLFILALMTMKVFWIYPASILLGMGAALMWTAQNTYLIQASHKQVYGRDAGWFNSMRTLGSGLGVMVFGVLLNQKMTFREISGWYFGVTLLGLIIASFLKRVPLAKTENHWSLLKQTFTNPQFVRLSMPIFLMMFLQGLIIGFLPEKIGQQWGIQYVGMVTSLFFLIPLVASYVTGIISDRIGRLKIIRIAYLWILMGLGLFMINQLWMWITGVVFLAFASAILHPAAMAVVGDVATEGNKEPVSAFFWFMRTIGVVGALLIGKLIQTPYVVPLSLGVSIFSFYIYSPLLNTPKGYNFNK